jgi:endonuclease/exonuclease/phosphatase family metal-dependent hydrolase
METAHTQQTRPGISVLTANIGNLSPGCRKYNFKLCYSDVERRISSRVAELAPDVVTFQEALPNWQYARFRERSPRKIGFTAHANSSAERILGSDYAIFVDARHQYLCTAVRKSFGKVVGQGLRTSPELPGCDNGFMVTALTVQSQAGLQFDLVNIHLQSSSARCRTLLLRHVFQLRPEVEPLVVSKNMLAMGDFNLDPWRGLGEDVHTWEEIMANGWRAKPLAYHSGAAEQRPPHPTSRFLLRPRSIDFVTSNFLGGVCATLGESRGTQRLDGGRGMDHRGIFGTLSYLSAT